MGNRRKFTRTDDPGGKGSQIAREIPACPDCARKVHQSDINVNEQSSQINASHLEKFEVYLRENFTETPEDG